MNIPNTQNKIFFRMPDGSSASSGFVKVIVAVLAVLAVAALALWAFLGKSGQWANDLPLAPYNFSAQNTGDTGGTGKISASSDPATDSITSVSQGKSVTAIGEDLDATTLTTLDIELDNMDRELHLAQ